MEIAEVIVFGVAIAYVVIMVCKAIALHKIGKYYGD